MEPHTKKLKKSRGYWCCAALSDRKQVGLQDCGNDQREEKEEEEKRDD